MERKFNTIEETIKDFGNGKMVIVVDDEDRENEGDFICAAEKITPEKVNFMLRHGRGVLCAPLIEDRCDELELNMQVEVNTSIHSTPFTISVDKLEGCTTGVSASDRAATFKALADPASTPETFGRPGHIFPLRARSKGVLRRAGHTEAAVDLAPAADVNEFLPLERGDVTAAGERADADEGFRRDIRNRHVRLLLEHAEDAPHGRAGDEFRNLHRRSPHSR